MGNIALTDVIPQDSLERQLYFIEKCKAYVADLQEKLGRPLTCCTQTFGCPIVRVKKTLQSSCKFKAFPGKENMKFISNSSYEKPVETGTIFYTTTNGITATIPGKYPGIKAVEL